MSSIVLGDRTLIDRIAVNRRRAIAVTAGTSALIGLIIAALSLLVVAPLIALVILVVVAVALAVAAWEGCDGLVARMIPSRRADPQTDARLFNLVNGLCITAGVPAPDLQILPAPGLNALAAGRHPKRATLVVTQGLLDRLTLIELEAVVARELSQIKGYDILPGTVSVALFGWLRTRPFSVLGATGLRLALGEQRDELADLSGMSLTRYPPALLSALEKMNSVGTDVPDVSPAVAHLWMADPAASTGPAPTAPAAPAAGKARPSWSPFPPLGERIEALREL